MTCSSTARVIADHSVSAIQGHVRWSPSRSLWIGGMTLAAVVLGPLYTNAASITVFVVTSGVTLCLGHSLGLHRLLIHRSFRTSRWIERTMVYLGTLVGMAGPLGMVRLHDTRDWAQRQEACHDLHAHRGSLLRDAWWEMHCRLSLAHPPHFVLGHKLAEDRFLAGLEATWMLQQIPLATLLYFAGGMPWLVWGVPVRIAICVTGHWFVGHLTHRGGPQTWRITGVAVQGHDLPHAALITFGEAWHGNHHAWPESARLGVEPGQYDPGWWVLTMLRRAGLVWDLKEPADLVPRAGLVRVETEILG